MRIYKGYMFYTDLTPVVGCEQGGTRPVLIIQNDIGNRYSPTVIVTAITSRTDAPEDTRGALKGQYERLGTYAEQMGSAVVGSSQDLGSGLNFDRPGLHHSSSVSVPMPESAATPPTS